MLLPMPGLVGDAPRATPGTGRGTGRGSGVDGYAIDVLLTARLEITRAVEHCMQMEVACRINVDRMMVQRSQIDDAIQGARNVQAAKLRAYRATQRAGYHGPGEGVVESRSRKEMKP